MSERAPEDPQENLSETDSPGEGAEQEPDHNELESHSDREAETPDVYLNVPVLKVDEINLEVEDLHARVSLQAEVLDLLKLNVGVDANLGHAVLDINGVEAQALLKVRLDNVSAIIDRVLKTIDRNPQILENISRGVESAARNVGEGAGDAVHQVGQGAGNAVEEVGEDAGGAVKQIGDGAGEAVQGVGQGASQATQDVGQGASQATQDVGQGASQATQDVGQGASQATQDVGQATDATSENPGSNSAAGKEPETRNPRPHRLANGRTAPVSSREPSRGLRPRGRG